MIQPMRKWFGLGLVIFTVFPWGAGSTEAAKAPRAYERYTYLQLDAVANYATLLITSAVDAQISRKHPARILACDPSQAQANAWTMSLKSIMDEKLGPEGDNYLARPVNDRVQDSMWKRCEQTCTCGSFAQILSSIDDAKLTPKDRELLAVLNQKRDAQTDATAMKCAKALKWFCSSALHTYLKNNR